MYLGALPKFAQIGFTPKLRPKEGGGPSIPSKSTWANFGRNCAQMKGGGRLQSLEIHLGEIWAHAQNKLA